ncbi:MAG: hypothetical protein FJY65_04685 [Calditrichaeota bacterium]|nr:hypothetical protein [Calditrichota bacterium]
MTLIQNNIEITREKIEHLKAHEPQGIVDILRNGLGSREVLFVLENLGHLPNGFDGDVFLDFINNSNHQIRLW